MEENFSTLLKIVYALITIIFVSIGYIVWSGKREKKYRDRREAESKTNYDTNLQAYKDQSNILIGVITKSNQTMDKVSRNITANTNITRETQKLMRDTQDVLTKRIILAARKKK